MVLLQLVQDLQQAKSFNVHHFGMVAATALKIMASRSPSMA
jgi:hypothetical protein